MGQHDLKAKEVQLETIISREIERILVYNILSYTEDYVFAANDLITLQRVQAEIAASLGGSGMIAPYDPDVPTNQNYPVTFFIDGVRYIFISQVDENTSVPSFDNTTYQVAGVHTDDINTSTITTWSSQKITDYVASQAFVPAVTMGDIPDTVDFLAIDWNSIEPDSGITYQAKHGSIKSIIVQFMVPNPLNINSMIPSIDFNVSLDAQYLTFKNYNQASYYTIK